MNCPHCNFKFNVLLSNEELNPIPEIAPIVCEDCGQVSLLFHGTPLRMTHEQMELVKKSPAWKDVIAPAIKIIEDAKKKKEEDRIKNIPPADVSKTILTDGSAVTPDHREIDPATGLQKGYIVLSDDERAKGFVRPVRSSYVHTKCGVVTTMSVKIAETYAREPKFYGATFCVSCRGHFPVGEGGEFIWDDGSEQKVGT